MYDYCRYTLIHYVFFNVIRMHLLLYTWSMQSINTHFIQYLYMYTEKMGENGRHAANHTCNSNQTRK